MSPMNPAMGRTPICLDQKSALGVLVGVDVRVGVEIARNGVLEVELLTRIAGS